MTAAALGLLSITEQLVRCGARPDRADGSGRTALHAALFAHKMPKKIGKRHIIEVAEWLLQHVVTADSEVWRASNGGVMFVQSEDSFSAFKIKKGENSKV